MIETSPLFKLPELIPVRMLNEYVFCPRLAYLEWVQGEFIDNEHTIEGTRRHGPTDETKGKFPTPEEIDQLFKFKVRGITISSDDVGMVSKMDIIEGSEGEVSPVEIKKGDGPDDGVWDADRMQIGSQMMLLRANGYNCNQGFVYYAGTNRKVPVPFDETLESFVNEKIKGITSLEERKIPEPLINSKKCDGCSLAGICLPDETILLNNMNSGYEIRPLYAVRDDEKPLIVNEQGAFISKSGEELVIKKNGEKLGSTRIMETSNICIYGNVQISTQALGEMMDRSIPVSYYSYGGWFKGMAMGMPHKNVELRIKQYQSANDEDTRLILCKQFVSAKIKNCRTMIMRNCEGPKHVSLSEMKKVLDKVQKVKKEESLLGLEGTAARLYFLNFNNMIKNGFKETFDFNTRNKRPPKDPINAMLSFCYSMLAKDLTLTALMVGFDPYLGFYHKPRYGRPALALDMMEEFRPIIADSTVITAINNSELQPEDFIRKGAGTTMTDEGRKKFIRSYERRMSTEIKHPMFGYQAGYRRILELQMRILARYLTGEIPEYVPFTTR